MIGELDQSGIGTPVVCDPFRSIDSLVQSIPESNQRLLQELRVDSHSEELLENMREDARKGLMTMPRKVESHVGIEYLLHPRFGVVQEKSDGTCSCRAIDNLSWAAKLDSEMLESGWSRRTARKPLSINGHTRLAEKLRHDTLDWLVAAMTLFFESCDQPPSLFKADIKSAFRLIPIAPEHRWSCGVALKTKDGTFVARHAATPFGAVASVHGWERTGAALCHLARRLLMLPILRYVDDYFSVGRQECVEHSMHCFARLVQLILGKHAIATKKLEWGPNLTILGIKFQLTRTGFRCFPSETKVRRWIAILEECRLKERMSAGLASKMAGKLSWGASRIFRKLGRAMLRALHDQKTRRDGHMSCELRQAVEWWLLVCKQGLSEARVWRMPESSAVHLFCDASGSPPQLAAVLFVDGSCLFTHMPAPKDSLLNFRSRADNQIMGLELLAISLGLSAFQEQLRGRKVVVHSDNTGSEVRLHT